MNSPIYNGVDNSRGDVTTSAKSYGQVQQAYNQSKAMVESIMKFFGDDKKKGS